MPGSFRVSSPFAVWDAMLPTEISLVDSYFESTSSNKDNGVHWAYAMRLYSSKIRIDNCEVKGIQGGISIEGCQDAVINGGKYYTENTPGQKDAFYALYITNGARVTIMDGAFLQPMIGQDCRSGERALLCRAIMTQICRPEM